MLSASPLGLNLPEIATSPVYDPQVFAAGGGGSASGGGGAAPLSETFFLHSNPGALKIIYLDFDGHITQNTPWNGDPTDPESPLIPTIVTPPYSVDEDGTFTSHELLNIQEIWARVAEDFRPFNVDVTTEDPGTAALASNGIRVNIGGSTNDWYSPPNDPAGGVALLNSLGGAADVGCFVFSGDAAGAVKFSAEAASHEAGHTVGLFHDGQVVPDEDPIEYYAGHGPGIGFPTGWAPIMGNGYGQELTQWSRNEYSNGVNTPIPDPPVLDLQDDLAEIAKTLPFRVDDHGNATTAAGSTVLEFTGSTFFAEGIIEQTTDLDVFSINVGVEEVTFDIRPAAIGPNLDILATLYDSQGNVIATSNPLFELGASFTINTLDNDTFQPGIYYIEIDGSGKPPTMDPGYSDYGSLGYYSITGERKPLLETIVGVEFDVPEASGGTAPTNWTMYSGGSVPTVLTNLINEQGIATLYDLTIASSTPTIVSHDGPINSGTIPLHPQPLNALDGFIATTGNQTLTFTWSDLTPLTVYEVYVFGLHDGTFTGDNDVQIVGAGTPISFSQQLANGELFVNGETGASDTHLVNYARTVAAAANGTITITVSNSSGAEESALAGLAIREGTRGSIHGQKWSDLNGDGLKGGGEPGLAGWTIFIDEDGNGQLSTNFTQDFNSPDVPENIPDQTAVGIKSELEVQGVAALQLLTDVNVTLDITHMFASDLLVYLISPSGTRVKLFDHVGGSGDNFTGTTFDDSAATSIASVTSVMAPFSGTFRPEGLLSLFNGQDGNGTWTLEVRDSSAPDIGVLNSWSLTLAGSEVFTVTDSGGNYSFPDLPPGRYDVLEVQQEGWTQTFAPPPVTLTSGARVSGINFGNEEGFSQPDPGTISGQKWNDLDGDGEKDATEPGLAGWTIFLDGNDNGILDATSPATVENTVEQAITDSSTVISPIVFDGLSTIVDVNVTLNITHTFDEDLEAFLISPSGTQVQLFTRVGGQFNNFINTTLDDQATTFINDGSAASAPFTGAFRPEGLLSDFNGENPNGTWKLLIRDVANLDVGTLNSWSLTIVSTEPSIQTNAFGFYEFAGLAPGKYLVREVQQPTWTQTYAPPTITDALGDQYNAIVVSNTATTANFGNRLGLLGDYNRDGSADMADFILYRKTLGTAVAFPFAGADGSGNGTVGPEDLAVWQANFGRTLSGGGGGEQVLAASSDTAQIEVAMMPAASPVAGLSEAGFVGNPIAPQSSSTAGIADGKIAGTSDFGNIYSLMADFESPLSESFGRTAEPFESPAETSNDAALVALLNALDDAAGRLDDELADSSDDAFASFDETDDELADDAGEELDGIDALFELIGA